MKILSIVLFVLLISFCAVNTARIRKKKGSSKPHIIVIVADDLGWNDVGFHGSNQIPTPNIDALAYSGLILNNYHVMPVCTPSRSALMTGKHPIHTGMQHSVIFGNEPWGLGLEERLLPEYLKSAGYATHAVGKWHLGQFRKEYTPTFRGFDTHYGYWGGHQDYYDHTAQDSRRFWGYDMRRGMNVSRESYGRYTTELFTEEAVRVIREHGSQAKQQPLFLYLSHLATHSANPYLPLQAPDDIVKKFAHIDDPNRRIFAGMLTLLDESVGVVVKELQDRLMLQNSIIVFTTDNGGAAGGFNENAASNWPLRGCKDTVWEGGVRGAALIWSPLLHNTPRVFDQLSHIQDLMPTLLSVANVSLSRKNSANLDGRDLWKAFDDPKALTYEELLLAIDTERNYSALRRGQYKLIQGTTWNGKYDRPLGPPGRDGAYNISYVRISHVGQAVNKTSKPLPSDDVILKLRQHATVTCTAEDPKLLCHPEKGEICLFDVISDPCESHNLAKSQSEVVRDLQQSLRRYAKTLVPPRNKPADPVSNPKYWDYTWTNWMDFPLPPALWPHHKNKTSFGRSAVTYDF